MRRMRFAEPPATVFTRARLKQISSWIRDDLDPIIARDGPDMLRADDVLLLHDVFQNLLVSQSITALDLRATHIHRAIMEVAGKATRWPGRLADDCDLIMEVWSAKFGRLDDLHPFIFGRGGRLEGIAAAADGFSRASLLKRWQSGCPDNLTLKRSHRHGHLGFRPGSWWLNPLFASHAGIIDVATTEGGICFDRDGAYAVFLKDATEVEALTENTFTYRCGPNDKGRFCLASATWRSRFPIRVLRSHSLNSVWAPKAGVRYEGLYKVDGWTIRTPPNQDTTSTDSKLSDVIFEIKFERIDLVPMSEVMKHPTAAETDDYAEYKRLRRLQREGLKLPDSLDNFKLHLPPAKTAPPIPPTSQIRASPRPSPNLSRNATFKDPTVTVPPSPMYTVPNPRITSPTRIIEGNIQSYLDVPLNRSEAPSMAHSPKPGFQLDQHRLTEKSSSSQIAKFATFEITAMKAHGDVNNNIREIAPWVDDEPESPIAGPIPVPEGHRLLSKGSKESKNRTTIWPKGRSREHSRHEESALVLPTQEPTKQKGNGTRGPRPGLTHRNSKHGSTSRNRNRKPLAKVFDGAAESESEAFADCVSCLPTSRPASFSSRPSRPMVIRHKRASSYDGLGNPLRMVPRPLIPPTTSPQSSQPCEGSYFPFNISPTSHNEAISPSANVPQVTTSASCQNSCSSSSQTPARSPKRPLPMSLKSFLSNTATPSPINITPTMTMLGPWTGPDSVQGSTISLQALLTSTLRNLERRKIAKKVKTEIVFRDPFKPRPRMSGWYHRFGRCESVEKLAPDALP